MEKGQLIIFSAPSGAGKTTIVKAMLLEKAFNLAFSISACSRKKRAGERNGADYFFLSIPEFKQRIADNAFIEYEEVYKDHFYGTLKNEIERLRKAGKNVVFDVDVLGGINIKKYFQEQALSIFIQPPSIDELQKRLVTRNTDSQENIEKRVKKAEYELTFANQFDAIIVNDNLEQAISDTKLLITNFLNL